MNDYYSDYEVDVIADIAILTENFTSKYSIEDRSYVNIFISPQDAGVLSYTRINGENFSEDKLNEGIALVAGCAYIFTIMISEDEINLKYSVDTTFSYLQLREVL